MIIASLGIAQASLALLSFIAIIYALYVFNIFNIINANLIVKLVLKMHKWFFYLRVMDLVYFQQDVIYNVVVRNGTKRLQTFDIKKTNMKKILFIISWSLLLISCEKEKIIEIEKEYKWKSHSDFQYNDIVQMNSYATKDRLFFLGYSSFSSLVPDSISHPDLPFGGTVALYDNWHEQPSEKKLPICADYFISYSPTNGWVDFIPTMNPVTSQTSVSFYIKNIDSTYAYFDFLHFSSGECIAINEQEQALIPYGSFVNSKNILKLALVDIKAKLIYNVKLDTIKTKILSITDDYQYNVIALESIGDYFFLTTNSKVYRVDKLGNIENVLHTRLNKIIESSGTLYGFGGDNIYISSNNGLTWDMGYSVQYEYSWLNYTKIDNKIIGYRYGQLWEISVTKMGLIAKELDNDGLDGISITSVSKFNEKVYLSTLSGVYYKLADDFLNYKIKIE